jgi:hypothetical protein
MRKKRLVSTKETEIRLKSHRLELERINSTDRDDLLVKSWEGERPFKNESEVKGYKSQIMKVLILNLNLRGAIKTLNSKIVLDNMRGVEHDESKYQLDYDQIARLKKPARGQALWRVLYNYKKMLKN